MGLRHQDVVDDIRGTIPELTEDFHSPCPNCGRPLVIHKDQPIRRVRCECNCEFTIDKRIGGQLCLLPVNTAATHRERAHIAATKLFRSRLFAFVLALGLVASAIGALMWNGMFVIGVAAAGLFLFLTAGYQPKQSSSRDLLSSSKARRRRRQKRKRA